MRGSILLLLLLILAGCATTMTEENLINLDTNKQDTNLEKKPLSEYVTKQNGTEPAFDNEYWNHKDVGLYVDVNTGEPLFTSEHKYDSGTGWPAFTDAIAGSSIYIQPDDSYGLKRTEVRSNESHLGHVFDDGPNGKPRYCINSAALRFVPYEELDAQGYSEYKSVFPYQQAVFGGGCFWGVEELFSREDGVIDVVSGYMGGDSERTTYKEVSKGTTGHAEVVQVTFDPRIISYVDLVNLFWRMHDPTQVNRQGPDVGHQYRSVIFYYSEEQKQQAEASKAAFDAKGVFDKPAATEIVPAQQFFKAEEYHQDYVDNHPGYVCHALRDE